jgi:hypothetical protein
VNGNVSRVGSADPSYTSVPDSVHAEEEIFDEHYDYAGVYVYLYVCVWVCDFVYVEEEIFDEHYDYAGVYV